MIKKFDPEIVVVAFEHCRNGNHHLHSWIEFKEIFTTLNWDEFDFEGKRAHIANKRDGKRYTRRSALNYLLKEDHHPDVYGLDLKEWKYKGLDYLKYIAEDLVNNELQLTEA